MNKPLILVVEDDIPVRNLITITLKTHGYRYLTAGTGDGAVIETGSPETLKGENSTFAHMLALQANNEK